MFNMLNIQEMIQNSAELTFYKWIYVYAVNINLSELTIKWL
jgi:hypothetical protein